VDDKNHDIIIIKRHGGHEEEHQGGAWKIAFADFMTAMMAFFLVLWIINATDKNTKTIIARYFNPLKLEDLTKSNKGIRQVMGDEAKEPQKEDGDLTPVEAASPSGKPGEAKQPASEESDKAKTKDGVADGVEDGPKDNASFAPQPRDAVHPKGHVAESTLLEDPYASLDEIAGKFAPTSGEPEGVGATPTPGDADAFIDPFKPVERSAAGGGGASAPAKAASAAPLAQPTPDAQLRPQDAPAAPQPPTAEAQPRPRPESKGPSLPPSPAEAQASAAPPPVGPAAAGASPAPQPAAAQAAPDAGAVLEAARLRAELGKELRGELHAQAAPGIDVEATPEGILISLTDALSFEMFAVGSAEPQAKVVRIMEKIARSLKSRPGEIVLRGHTDGRQYKSGTYDNWRLSEARAQMAYYMLIRGGLEEKRVERIEGFADRRLKTPDKPEAAENRRIEILLREEKP
jgi:chemotaxis protein MotB